ncbi:hypothetical protein HanRHA438_Chr13g0610321 [Helianthus annuus]|nr:hypothetical protein HanRHA438_Chr13g0610321 [Helianthus annuus]
MLFLLYNFPLVQKRTGCAPLRGIVFLLKKKRTAFIGPRFPSLLPFIGASLPKLFPDLAHRLDGGTAPLGKIGPRTGSPRVPRSPLGLYIVFCLLFNLNILVNY